MNTANPNAVTITNDRAAGTVKANSKEALERLQQETEAILAPLGYEVAALLQTQSPNASGRTLTLYIDFLPQAPGAEIGGGQRRISLEDCVIANRAVDALFESTPLLEGAYTLDVSSPGVERPLRKPSDYERFRGRAARLHTFRPLEREESENEEYWARNPRQKNFTGDLVGLSPDGAKVRMRIDGQTVAIPLPLISKAHLEFTPEEEQG